MSTFFVLARESTKNVAAGLDFARNRARRRGDNEWSMRPACTLWNPAAAMRRVAALCGWRVRACGTGHACSVEGD